MGIVVIDFQLTECQWGNFINLHIVVRDYQMLKCSRLEQNPNEFSDWFNTFNFDH